MGKLTDHEYMVIIGALKTQARRFESSTKGTNQEDIEANRSALIKMQNARTKAAKE